jgi:5'-3' exoribonuclease 1
MAIDSDHVGKINLGLSVKFEAKAQKVLGYSRKVSQHWEFSEKTVDLIKEYKVINAEMLIPAFLPLICCAGKIP